MYRFTYRILKAIAVFIYPVLFRLQVVGAEHFPQQGPYLLATNHISAFDIPVLFIVCPHNIHAFAADKHKRNPFFAPILAVTRVVWVRRGEVDREALREAFEVLERGEVLGVAPEGTRARGPYALQAGKTGVTYLATRANVPIIPVGVTGTEKLKDNLRRLRRTTVRVVVGEPMRLPENARARGPLLEAYTDDLMRRIAALLPVEYRGVYA